ncbi:MAG: sigma-70 family RNA polymerase sigma factor [Firmicutes bacterium]|nr:sigma-70 family RNA polymerase sigma factor [Bacillota bacterium]
MAAQKANAVREAELWQLLQAGDKSARDELMAANMQLVFWLARRFTGRGLEWDDLCQVGAIGLLKAIDNFRPEYNNRFSTYAVPMIMGELRRALRDDSLLHISRSYKEKIAQIAAAGQAMLAELGREPTISELAARLQLTEGEIVDVLDAARKPISLETPLNNAADNHEGEAALLNLLAADDGEDVWVSRLALQDACERLPQRLRYIMEARYYKEETQAVIAGRLGISQVQVSRLEKQALLLLRAYWQDKSSTGS